MAVPFGVRPPLATGTVRFARERLGGREGGWDSPLIVRVFGHRASRFRTGTVRFARERSSDRELEWDSPLILRVFGHL